MRWKLFVSVILIVGLSRSQTRVDLRDISICLDPGHGIASDGSYLNPGAYGYTETEKVLSVALHLKSLLEQAGVDTVILTRTSNAVDVSLTQRTAMGNNVNADWFHSIHSNAFTTSATNYVIVLLEEKRQYSDSRTSESSTRGPGLNTAYWQGQADVMSRLMADKLARTYRVPNNGMRLDWTFYGGTNGGFTLGVLRTSLMPATLSEGAFHTNPTQNLRNMNEQYRRAEARALLMSFQDYFGVSRPPVRTAIGIVSDKSSGAPLNDVDVLSINQPYKTNGYSDTFKYSLVPDTTTGNGVYYFENLPAGPSPLTFRKPGYRDTTISVSVSDTFYTFQDVSLGRIVTNVSRQLDSTPLQFTLEQNYPNPFNPTTVISFTVPQPARVRLDVLNLLGELVATLLDEEREAGQYQATWNGTNQEGNTVPSGMYFYKLRQGSSTLTRKMIFVR